MKKRTFKRVASAIAALTMAASLAVPMTISLATTMMTASATTNPNQGSEDHTIVVTTESGAGDHQYLVYKIFDGVVEAIDETTPGTVPPGSAMGWDNDTIPRTTFTQYLRDVSWAKSGGKDAADILPLLKGTVGGNYSVASIDLPVYDKGTYSLPEVSSPNTHTLAEIFANASNAASVAKILELYKDNADFSRAFANFLANSKVQAVLPLIDTNQTSVSTTETKISFVNQSDDPACTHDGYYIIIESTFGDLDGNTEGVQPDEASTKTVHILGVYDASEGATVNAKGSYPDFQKKVRDYNDSKDTGNLLDKTKDASKWTDTADYDIGDAVEFRLSATIPNSYADYETYTMTFHDDLDTAAGNIRFELIDNWGNTDTGANVNGFTVWIDLDGDGLLTESDITLTRDTDYEVTTKNGAGHSLDDSTTDTFMCDLEITILDLNKLSEATLEKINEAIKNPAYTPTIIVDYSATLTGDAEIGKTGNWNEAYLEYPRNPNLVDQDGTPKEDDETSHTPVDRVGVFTFQLNVDKVDKNGNALEGAEFTLEKWNAEKGQWVPVDVQGLEDSTDPADTKEAGSPELNQYYTKTRFEFKGIDDGYYRLVESKVPDGYNAIDPEYFEVVGTHTTDEEVAISGNDIDALELRSLECYKLEADTKNKTGAAKEPTPDFNRAKEGNSGEQTDVKWGKIDLTTTTAYIENKIENRNGSFLPSTGGIGTTLFYLIGGTLVVGAGITLITKKRVEKEN